MEKVRCKQCNSELHYKPFYSQQTVPPLEGIQLTCDHCLEEARQVLAPVVPRFPVHPGHATFAI